MIEVHPASADDAEFVRASPVQTWQSAFVAAMHAIVE